MNCPQCGKPLANNHRFCPSCGKAVDPFLLDPAAGDAEFGSHLVPIIIMAGLFFLGLIVFFLTV